MKYLPPALLVLLLVFCCVGVWADDSTATQDQGIVYAQQLYCQFKAGFSSYTGLFVGLGMAMWGLYQLVRGNMTSGLIMIVAGALLTALPSVIESMIGGVGTALGGISLQSSLKLPNCSGS